jgi:uncharacterized protein YdbL (DUF1318 family)
MFALRTFLVTLGIALAAFAFAPSASAGDPQIDAAIVEGVVGERIDGRLGVVGTADAALVRKVQDINNRRAAVYAETAAKTGTTVDQVARIAGEKQIEKLAPGQFYMDESGTWQRK